MKHNQKILIILLLFCLCSIFSEAEEIQVSAALEKNYMYLGESFIFQITVNGSNTPEEPQLTGFDDFSVAFLGGADNTSTSIYIVNGKQTVTKKEAYVFQYQLSPRKTGTLTIPSVMVKAGGRNYMTEPFAVTVSKPEEVEDYKFRIRLDSTTCFVGEKVTVTVTWYLAKEAKGPIEFTIPLFNDSRFDVLSPEVKMDSSKEYVTLVVENEQINAEYSSGTLSGKSYNTVFFKKILIPKKPGNIPIAAATLSFQGVAGYKRDFWGRNIPAYTKMVIPSNTLSINVRTIPETGKPANYSGLVGNYSITVSAAPLEVRVGDPITLTLTLKGTGFLEDAKIPPLHEMPELTDDFKIPHDMAPGEVKEDTVVFIQTFRAVHDSVDTIPAIRIPYFSVKSNKYEYAVSKPIPIHVEPATSELSVLDMEGTDPIEFKREIEIWEEGIAANYEGYDVLRDQAYGLDSFLRNPLIIFLIVLPVLTYFALLYIFRFSPLVRGDMNAVLVKKSFSEIKTCLEESIEQEINEDAVHTYFSGLMDKLRTYLGAKLRTKPGSITFKDVELPLKNHGVPGNTTDELKKVFETCEASHYAGGSFHSGDAKTLSRKTLDIITEIERSFT